MSWKNISKQVAIGVTATLITMTLVNKVPAVGQVVGGDD